MTIPKTKLREILFLLLFAKMQGMKDEPATIALVMEQLKVAKSHVNHSLEKAKRIEDKYATIDQELQKVLIDYDLERIQTVEKTALRLGVYELLYEKLPPKVAIAEAIRLTKKFSTLAATSFVNALLDALYKLHQGEPVDSTKIKDSFDELHKSYGA